MTNGNRVKRGLASDSRCEGCNGSLEDAMHVLRDCPHVMTFWQVLLPGNKWNEFFSGECREWLTKNVMRREIEGIPLEWNVLFTLGCWWLWCWQNQRVFEPGKQLPFNKVTFVVNQVR